MTLSPQDVRAVQFTTTRMRVGYEMSEVDDFLDRVEATLAAGERELQQVRERELVVGQDAFGLMVSEPEDPAAAECWDVHRRHVEVRVLEPTQSREREGTCQQSTDDQKEHERAMCHRPFGKIEALHRAPAAGVAVPTCTVPGAECALASGRRIGRTFMPASNLCAPTVMTIAPSARPATRTRSAVWDNS